MADTEVAYNNPEDFEILVREFDAVKREQARVEAIAVRDNLSVAERLTRRTRKQTAKVVLYDDMGPIEFEVYCRPSIKTAIEILQVQEEWQKALSKVPGQNDGTEGVKRFFEELDRVEDKMARLLASLCVDKSLDYDFWKNGDYDQEVVYQIISTVLNSTQKEVDAAKN